MPAERGRARAAAAARSPERYARLVARIWQARVGREEVLSPRDFALIAAWHERGVSLEVVREVLEASLAGGARRGPPRLASLAPAVDEAWEVIRGGRTGEAPATVTDPARAAELWRARRDESPGAPGARWLDALLARLAAGEDPARLDAELDDALVGLWPEAAAEVAREVELELAPYRERLAPERLAESRRRATVARLRRRLLLPPLGGP